MGGVRVILSLAASVCLSSFACDLVLVSVLSVVLAMRACVLALSICLFSTGLCTSYRALYRYTVTLPLFVCLLCGVLSIAHWTLPLALDRILVLEICQPWPCIADLLCCSSSFLSLDSSFDSLSTINI